MRFTIRKQFMGILLYGFITTVQKVSGITSFLDEKGLLHHPVWDFDETELSDVIKSLEKVKEEFKLNAIIIMSDKDKSFRAIAPYDAVDYRTLLHIMISTDGLDFLHFKWTVKRGYGTIRVTKKKFRQQNKIVYVIGGNPLMDYSDIPKIRDFIFVEYETDIDGVDIKF